MDALSRALHLDEAERAHLFDLAHAANTGSGAPTCTLEPQVRPSIQRVLDSMSTTPAYLRNRRLDILATNRLGKALINPILAIPRQPPNVARFMFLDAAATDYYPETPHDKALTGLVGELTLDYDALELPVDTG